MTRYCIRFAVLALFASVLSAGMLSAQGSSCDPATAPFATKALQDLRQLASRTDSAASSLRAAYHFPAGVTAAEIVAVTDDSVCATAAALYFQTRDSSYTAPKPVFVARIRDVYFVQESSLRGPPGDDRQYLFSMVANSSLSTVLQFFRSL